MTETYSQSFRARWVDMDFNQHMRNGAYLGYSEDTRMLYLDSKGFTMKNFVQQKFGPVVLEDKLVYRKELGLLEPFRVEMSLAAITPDGGRMKVRNTFFRESDNALCATVDSVILWFNIEQRKPIVPPDQLKEIWLALPRTEDFENWQPKS